MTMLYLIQKHLLEELNNLAFYIFQKLLQISSPYLQRKEWKQIINILEHMIQQLKIQF